MKIIDAALLAEFRLKKSCELCGRQLNSPHESFIERN